MFSSIIQMVGIFLVTQFVISQFTGNKSAGTTQGPGVSSSGIPAFEDRPLSSEIANYSTIPQFLAPIWPADSEVDISVYISPSIVIPSFASFPAGSHVIDEKNFKIGDYKEKREIQTSITLPKAVQENGTLWAHFYVALTGYPQDPSAKEYDFAKAYHFARPLTQYLPKKRVRKLKNLLDKGNETVLEEEGPKAPQVASYYHPNFTVAVISDAGIQNWPSMHPALRRNIVIEPSGARDSSGQNGWYYPTIFLNTFWQLRSHMTELNDTVKQVPLNIDLKNMKSWQYSMVASIDEGIKQQATQAQAGGPMQMQAGDGTEFEKFKEILLDTNSYLLATTFVVSIFHMIFEMLAFKNDISHWRTKKDNVGTSVRTIVANVFMQLVIFLYLVDNSDGTSWMILASQGFGIFLEAWKITKTVNVRLRAPDPKEWYSFLPAVIVFEDKYKLSDVEKKTQEYDQIAFKYLYIVAVPLLGAYAAYSLVYETHKSWYSFVIETLVGSVYAYGFLMMVPSLYINYRLKSVAHMPGRAMTYKFLNTFIDDLFAFTVRMPTLHRLATLRDDVIFFIWLYQKWAYRVDYTRVNEFGQGGDDEDEPVKVDGGEGKKKALDGQDTKELKPAAAVASATGAEKLAGATKRKG